MYLCPKASGRFTWWLRGANERQFSQEQLQSSPIEKGENK
jgi:hypothetical protein